MQKNKRKSEVNWTKTRYIELRDFFFSSRSWKKAKRLQRVACRIPKRWKRKFSCLQTLEPKKSPVFTRRRICRFFFLRDYNILEKGKRLKKNSKESWIFDRELYREDTNFLISLLCEKFMLGIKIFGKFGFLGQEFMLVDANKNL